MSLFTVFEKSIFSISPVLLKNQVSYLWLRNRSRWIRLVILHILHLGHMSLSRLWSEIGGSRNAKISLKGDYGSGLSLLAHIQTALAKRGDNVFLSTNSEKLSEKSGLQNVQNRFLMYQVWTNILWKSASVKNTLPSRVYGIGPFLPFSSIFMISSWKKLFSSLLYQSIGVLIEPSDWSS